MIRASILLFILPVLISGCIYDSTRMGPCVHEYREPVLTITEVTDQNSQQLLQEVKITALKRGNFEYNLDPENGIFVLSMAENIEHESPLLICTIPCGFEIYEGTYTLQIEAEGYRDKTIETEATYQRGGGSCPSFSDDGIKINFSLEPED